MPTDLRHTKRQQNYPETVLERMMPLGDIRSICCRVRRRLPNTLLISNAVAVLLLLCAGCGEPSGVALPMESRWERQPCEHRRSTPLKGDVVIKGNVEPPCLLAIKPTAVFLANEEADPILPIRQLSDGRFAALTSGREVGIWSADGRSVALFGRSGAGPGELRRAATIYVDVTDTLFVADQGSEVEVFDSSGRWVRGMNRSSMQHYESAAILTDGRFLVTPPHYTTGKVFALLDRAEGKRAPVIGMGLEEDASPAQVRPVAYNGGETFWVASSDEYRLELWGLDGGRRASIVRDVPWFPASEASSPSLSHGTVSPTGVRPTIATFALDEHSVLWVAVLVPGDEQSNMPEDVEVVRAFDLHVEAFDGTSGELIYSERLDDPYEFMPPPFLGNGRAVRVRPNEDGILEVNIVEYKLVTRR